MQGRREGEQRFKVPVHGSPWWSSGSESAHPCRGHWSDPWAGKTPHAMEQLNLCTTTTEAKLSRDCSAAAREVTAMRSPPSTARN